MRGQDKRRHLIEVAIEHFNRDGYHATGVDRIIETSGIAKTTLYRHFETKEALIVAALRTQDEGFRDGMRATVEATTADPAGRLLATFDYLATWLADPTFRGCPFVCAVGEFGDATGRVYQEARMHKRLVLAYFEELAHAAGLARPKRIAAEINLLHEGAVAVAQVTGDPDSAGRARTAAARLLDVDLRSSGSGLAQ